LLNHAVGWSQADARLAEDSILEESAMFSITGTPLRLCDGLSRRELLRVGGLTLAGLSLPQLLAREAAARPAAVKARAKSCLVFFLEGGPSHIDLWDLKPDAPAEVRGEFKPVGTTVPGLHVCEHLPLLSQQMHRLAQVRSVHHAITDHNAGTYYSLTGRYPVDGSRLIVANSPKNFPPYGAVLAKLRPTGKPLPAFVHIPEYQSNLGVDIAGQSAGFLGGAYEPFIAGDPSLPDYEIPGMSPARDVPQERLDRRERLLKQLDRSLAGLGDDPALGRMDLFHRKALSLITSPETRKAFDLSREPLAVRERYGMDPGSDRSIEARKFGGLPHLGQCALLARRLLEAGVRLVTLISGRRIDQAWDTHRDHFPLLKRSLCPYFDRACSALLEDLHQRGLLDETLVVLMGEFGRTPKLGYVTSNAGAARNGRDHWPYCYTVMFAGAGIPGGAIYGASDRQGGYPSREPVTPEDITATIYAALGIPADTEIYDNLGRPHPLILGQPIKALLQ
jgi:hypothetical protein